MITHSEMANLLWGTATLPDDFKWGHVNIILASAVMRRIDIVPEPTKDEAPEAYRESKAKLGAEIREVQRGIAQMMKEVMA